MPKKSDSKKATMKMTEILSMILIITTSLIIFVCESQCAGVDKVETSFIRQTKKPVQKVCIVNIYPHDSRAFTQGLFYDKGYLYESTGIKGRSSLRQVELKTGRICKYRKIDDRYFAEGITRYRNKIYQLTWQERTLFIYDLESLKRIRALPYESEGWGIATDGHRLFTSDGSSKIAVRDPVSFRVKKILTVKDENQGIERINEMEYIQGEIWANLFMEDVIIRISPISGEVLGWIDLAPLYAVLKSDKPVDVLNGIAYDRETGRIFVTGKLWPYVFEIKIE